MASRAQLRQNAFRWRNDDGNEAGATWSQALNTDPAAALHAGWIGRLRIEVLEYAGKGENAQGYTLISRVNGGTWESVGSAGSPVRLFDSAHITGTPQTTQQISSGAFVAGDLRDANGSPSSVEITSNTRTEFEFCLELELDKWGTVYTEADTIDFGVASASLSVLDDYAVIPSITVAPLVQFSRLYLGSQKINNFYHGGNLVPHIYLGAQEVYRNI